MTRRLRTRLAGPIMILATLLLLASYPMAFTAVALNLTGTPMTFGRVLGLWTVYTLLLGIVLAERGQSPDSTAK